MTRLRLAVLIGLAFAACVGPTPAEDTPRSSEPPLYVDVRTPAEHSEGHVAGSILIPHDQIEQRWQELSEYTHKPIVLYCRTGRRSGLALDVLKNKGFTNVRNGGGLQTLKAQGVPTQ
ncbi:MAG TPA: rhodanese-like domain-containing protein [Vicinamibacterales bacterium]|nr:rhodanese-like domain-containing protein [Vicinamibacterales bacterium]